MGIDDEFSDVDLWLLQTEADLAKLDAASETRFFEFNLDGKPGHLNATSMGAFSDDLSKCNMCLIHELRTAAIITDNTGAAAELLALARRTMPDAVRSAFFFYHYVEMRSYHRACDNPMERRDAVAVLLTAAKCLTHALKAAMALDGEPWPYEKWLHHAAVKTPTGSALAPGIETILNLLAADKLRFEGPEADNPISREMHGIRRILIDAARAKGINEPWLNQWWLHMDQARDAVENTRWQEPVGEQAPGTSS